HRVAGSTLTLYLETPGLYFICGHSAYKALPAVIPDVQINKTLDSSQILNLGSYSHRLFKPPIRTRTKRAENPLVVRQTGFHSFVRALIPGLGVAELEKAVVN
ncbi:endogenous retrovirus group MER34 member 1, partial [Chelydra serpentina]